MTVPGGNGMSSTSTDMLPIVAPFDGSSQGPSSKPYPAASKSSRHNWSLWPLKMSSTSLTHRSGQPSSSSPHSSSSRAGIVYPGSITSSPPSPFGVGNHSDSSPPTTPPDDTGGSSFTFDVPRIPSKADQQQLIPRSPSNPASSPSRNSIFSSPVASPIPAPRLQTVGLEGTGLKTMPNRSADRSVGFFGSPISQAASSPQSSIARGIEYSLDGMDLEYRPNYGRANTEEREKERDRIRRNNAEVDFRLCPVKDYLLGEGRHCTVYLGSYRTKRASYLAGEGDIICSDWSLCAIKRLHADRQSQLLGLEEAFALRRLGSHPNIVRLISIRDEVELATSSLQNAGESSWSGVAVPVSLNREQQDEMQYSHISKGLPSSLASNSSHWRSVSESQADPLTTSDKLNARRTQTHRRQVSTPTKGPIVMVASPEGEEMYTSPIAPESSAWDSIHLDKEPTSNFSGVDPPRLLILLELLPYSLSSFAKKSPDRVDFIQWKQWALELVSVVEWLHIKGCVHADLKPENILLTSDLRVKLCDFNSALFPSPHTPLTDGLGLGTPAYGAPELASRSGKGFSYPVDVWSLGAILYTLAVGVEPFRTARSMIDILHRKTHFFASEEKDRTASLSVAEGRASSINGGGSTTASRNGSLRGKRKGESDLSNSTARPTGALQRELSCESVSSIASSVMLSGSSGRNPSIRAVNMLLEPSPPIAVINTSGLNTSPIKQFRFGNDSRIGKDNNDNFANASPFKSSLGHSHHRATSLGKVQGNSLLSPDAARTMSASSRPSSFRRTNSYGGDKSNAVTSEVSPSDMTEQEEELSRTSKRDSTGLRLAVTAALGQSGPTKEEAEDADLLKPYKDGSPALLLPGGGRLPDEARDLLERMLSTNADQRPTAAQVKQQLEAL